MNKNEYLQKAKLYLNTFCSIQPNRQVGSTGNRRATDFFADIIGKFGYSLDNTPFQSLDFISRSVSLSCEENSYEILASPFSLGCNITENLVTVTTIEELEKHEYTGKILLMKDDLCAEQLMPKNFIFYNPDHHKKIYSQLEKKIPSAIITATSKNPQLAGAVYPFPLIEDGDFNIPSVYCKDIVGNEIFKNNGKIFTLISETERIPTTSCNVIGRMNRDAAEKIVICAHIDAKATTPGALDNAAGIIVLLLLAEMLKDYNGRMGIEIIAFNGEDYFSAGGQMDYLSRYRNEFERIVCAINIDGAGYISGKTSLSSYNCPEIIGTKASSIIAEFKGIIEGEQWYQGDHMIFVQNERPAIAITSEKFTEIWKDIAHTPEDTPDLIECEKLFEIAAFIHRFISEF
jgi:aminopeptidase YwaD